MAPNLRDNVNYAVTNTTMHTSKTTNNVHSIQVNDKNTLRITTGSIYAFHSFTHPFIFGLGGGHIAINN